MGAAKTSFVIMGFGEKTDYSTGRVLNLDATYKHVIKPAVEAAGVVCTRADEIVHAGVIDVPMFQQLLGADVVIADLSTCNPNAFYELGVRHALRPFTTIVISEDKLKYPFDVNHTVIRTYEHLGKDIGYGEAERFRKLLTEAVLQILQKQEKDSPVYTFITGLKPPSLEQQAAAVAAGAASIFGKEAGEAPRRTAEAATGAAAAAADTTMSVLMDQCAQKKASGDFGGARDLLRAVHTLRPSDSYVTQQLALATYKSEQPSVLAALYEARTVLGQLGPATTNDPETLGLWGAIHKRLWEVAAERDHLDEAIRAYEKGFYVKNDYYNGINLAFLLNVRASLSEPADAIADWVAAERVRRRTIALTEARLAAGVLNAEEQYWLQATLSEAYLGLGDQAQSETWLASAAATAPQGWMKKSTTEQLAKLAALLEKSPLRYLQPVTTSDR
jgi:hypothetical protein